MLTNREKRDTTYPSPSSELSDIADSDAEAAGRVTMTVSVSPFVEVDVTSREDELEVVGVSSDEVEEVVDVVLDVVVSEVVLSVVEVVEVEVSEVEVVVVVGSVVVVGGVVVVSSVVVVVGGSVLGGR